MSEAFAKVLVKDDRLGCITSKAKFQVLKGGQNITCQPFEAISETKASHVYYVAVPSLETIFRCSGSQQQHLRSLELVRE